MSNVNPEAIKRIQERHRKIGKRMSKIEHKIAVLSGKGGVGKSFVTASLASALAAKGRRVTVLDADIHGPSIPKLLGVHGQNIFAGPDGLIPVETEYGVGVVSLDFMLPSEDTPVVWRGPLKTNAIGELLAEVNWGDLDYLLVDLPPGTGDEALSIAQMIHRMDGALIVTIPTDLSRMVVEKAVVFAKRLRVPVLGIVENMSGFTCPDTGKIYYIFGRDGGKRMAAEMNVDFLGSIPIDPRISESNDRGIPFFVAYPDSGASRSFLDIAERIIIKVEGTARKAPS